MQINAENYIQQIEKLFENNNDSDISIKMENYMRNQFEFLGIKSPKRKDLTRHFLRVNELPPIGDLEKVVNHFWESPKREYQYLAMEIANKYTKSMTVAHFKLLESMITTKSWWDTVDFIASNLVGSLYLKYPEEGFKQIELWRKSGNLWLVRTCIIFQLKFKENVDEKLLCSLIEENKTHPDFFIRKAIGWALRQYSKYKPERVKDIVNRIELSKLSNKEALKYISLV